VPVLGRLPEPVVEEAPVELVVAPTAATVRFVVRVRAVPLGATPVSSMVWAPTGADAGIVRLPLTFPAESTRIAPRAMGSEWSVAATQDPGFQPAEVTATVPPGVIDDGLTVMSEDTVVEVEVLEVEPGVEVEVLDVLPGVEVEVLEVLLGVEVDVEEDVELVAPTVGAVAAVQVGVVVEVDELLVDPGKVLVVLEVLLDAGTDVDVDVELLVGGTDVDVDVELLVGGTDVEVDVELLVGGTDVDVEVELDVLDEVELDVLELVELEVLDDVELEVLELLVDDEDEVVLPSSKVRFQCT
jgi:hypothetical protein